MVFDPAKLKQHSQKGKFGIKTQKNEVDTSASVALRNQQDLLLSRLNNSLRSSRGCFELPRLYTLKGKQILLYQQALQSLGVAVSLEISGKYSIDRTGYCPDIIIGENGAGEGGLPVDYLGNNFIVISPEQNGSSIINPRYSFLGRLLNKIEEAFGDSIASFTRSEAVIGTITNTVIEQGVERFLKEGTYKEKNSVDVRVTIDTPSKAITSFRKVMEGTALIEDSPDTITDLTMMNGLYDLTENLKNIHKKLGDLVLPESDSMNYEVTHFKYGDKNLELYYLRLKKPVFVFFTHRGSNQEGMPEDFFGSDFIILNGNDLSRLIDNLLDLEMVDYLVENIESIRDSHVKQTGSLLSGFKAVSGGESDLPKTWHDLNDIAAVLRLSDPAEVAKHIRSGFEPDYDKENLESVQGQYIRSLDTGLKSQVIFPRTEAEDRLICDLISQCGESRSLNVYNSFYDFKSAFQSKTDEEKQKMLKDVDDKMRFRNQNNLLANYWLSQANSTVCSEAGITFEQK